MSTEEAEAQVLQRLEDGAGEKCLFLPYSGMEHGHFIMTWVRQVFFSPASHRIVCAKPQDFVFFPNAFEFYTNWQDPIPDAQKIGSNRRRPIEWPSIIAAYPDAKPIPAGGLTVEQELVCIHPGERIPFHPKPRGLRPDVVLGVRHRPENCRERNWGAANWQRLADALHANGITFATAGMKPTSLDLRHQEYHLSDFGDSDATVEALQHCKLYIGTDTGITHEAVEIGCECLVFRHEGRSRCFYPQMLERSPALLSIVPDGWTKPQAVISRALSILLD